MMARQHVTFAVGLTGVGLATAAYAIEPVEHWVRDEPWSVGLFLLLIAGGALVPDLDHPKSTLTKKLGWVGAALNWSLRTVGIRHRGLLHSFFFALMSGTLFAILTMVASIADYLSLFVGALLVFFASVTFGFIFGKTGRNPALVLALAVAIAYGVHTEAVNLGAWWLPIGAFAGPLLHDLGDMLTKSKFPFWAPFSKKRVGSFVGFKTNTPFFERVLLRWTFFVWSLSTLAWVIAMHMDALVKADLSAVSGWQDLVELLPFILWVVPA